MKAASLSPFDLFPMNDADFEMHELERTGNTLARLRKKGICCHGWIQAPHFGPAKCLDCGKLWVNAAALHKERDQLLAEYL
jgi:hypothetical protein